MIHFLDLNYYFFDSDDLPQILKKYDSNYGYLFHLPKDIKTTCFIPTSTDELRKVKNVNFILHKGKKLKKYNLPFKIHRKLKKENPDYILIHGLGYGLYSFFLKRILKKDSILIVQEHGPSVAHSGIKGMIYKYMDKYVDGYFFTGKKNASSWIKKGIFPKEKIFEIMEGSTSFSYDPNVIQEENSYLWVGRLNNRKDPLTLINAFDDFLDFEPLAKLTIIYFNDTQLLDAIISKIELSKKLKNAVNLIDKVPHDEIKSIYQQHKFFISGSYYEGSGYSLMESMACGCIPIISKIPPFMFMTNDGKSALLFSPGNKNELVNQLKKSTEIDYFKMQEKVLKQFEDKLSHKAIANHVINAFETLSSRKSL